MNFKQWLNETELSFPLQQAPNFVQAKPWKAKKDEIMNYWKNVPPNLPMPTLRVIPKNYKGKTFSFDSIRVTGSDRFINVMLSKLKDIVVYENEKNRINIIYKQQVDNKTQRPIPNSYVLYISVRKRGS